MQSGMLRSLSTSSCAGETPETFAAFVKSFPMYCLLMFFRAVRTELAPIRPVGKFLCVKSVVFLTFWQSAAIDLAFRLGLIPFIIAKG